MILEYFNYIFFFCYNLVSLDEGYSLIFESLVSTISLDIFYCQLNIEIIIQIL